MYSFLKYKLFKAFLDGKKEKYIPSLTIWVFLLLIYKIRNKEIKFVLGQ